MLMAKHAATSHSAPPWAIASTPSVKKLSAIPIQIAPGKSYSLNFPVAGNRGIVLAEKNQSAAPIGTLIAKSHGHDATARIVPPIVGPAAALVATVSAIHPVPRPSMFGG